MVHVTDWLPTLLEFGGCPGLDYGGKSLDGISLASSIFDESKNNSPYQPREEILHFMNPHALSERTDARESEWKNGPLKDKCFAPTTRAVLRWKQWKLLTGYKIHIDLFNLLFQAIMIKMMVGSNQILPGILKRRMDAILKKLTSLLTKNFVVMNVMTLSYQENFHFASNLVSNRFNRMRRAFWMLSWRINSIQLSI